ncbi:MAG: nuclear transport factor 2 family protein [bacterium]|nr:nuclear transport factor 2 family protein [bacterium]
MKAIVSIVVLAFAMCSAAVGQDEKGSVEDQLIALDKAWTAAELKGDKKAAGALIADDYIGTTQRGKIENKTEYLASVVPNSDMIVSDDYKITVHGDIAIMTHRATLKGVRNLQFRSTHVWQKRGGKWLIIAHHGSQITPEVD